MSVGGWGPEIIAMATHKNNPVRKGWVCIHTFSGPLLQSQQEKLEGAGWLTYIIDESRLDSVKGHMSL